MNNWIDNIVETYNTNDIYELCDCVDIRIVKLDHDNPILRGHDSIYHRSFNNKEIIFIRNDLEFNYEKFILSHELGHAIVHPDIFKSTLNKALLNTSKLEKQADYFAFKLLDITLDEVDLHEMTIEQVAGYLELPVKNLENISSIFF